MQFITAEDHQAYFTPDRIARKMVDSLSLGGSNQRYLDPSAGTGVLLEKLKSLTKHSSMFSSASSSATLNAIEINQEYRYVLQGKGFKVLHSDFLTYSEPVEFDAIVMNPPFLNGVHHLLKAWSLLVGGGQIVCLLNAETVNNPHTKERRLVQELILKHGKTEFLGKCFETAARSTDVEVVMINLTKPKVSKVVDFDTFGFKTHETIPDEEFAANPLASNNFLESLVAQYKSAETALVDRNKLNKKLAFFLQGTGTKYSHSSADQRLDFETDTGEQVGELKRRFWNLVFVKSKIGQRTTSSFQKDFDEFRRNQINMAFSVENVTEMLLIFFQNFDEIMLESIVKVFDKATSYHEENKVHWEGWKTNKGYKLDKKIIWPYGVKHDGHCFSCWDSHEFLDDLDRVLCYLSGKKFPEDLAGKSTFSQLSHHCDNAERASWMRQPLNPVKYSDKFESHFFTMRMYKKGTLHLVFRDAKLLEDFNKKAAQGKKWMGGDGF